MFDCIILNEGGTYEIRRRHFLGWTEYFEKEFEGGFWWAEQYRKNSTKYPTLEAAKQDFRRGKTPRPTDKVVWPV